MEKEDSKYKEENRDHSEKKNIDNKENNSNNNENLKDKDKEQKIDLSPEEEIDKLKDKLTRTFAEMENQRRRFEKEKEDAFEYGGFAFAK